jgi:uncharacterized protein (DUF2225 family)
MGLDDKLVRKKLEVLLKEESLVETYLRTYGPRLDMNYVAKVKAAQVKASAGGAATGENGDATYQIKVKCPICNQDDIVCHELKAKSLTIVPDRFMAPRFQPVKGFRPLNYSLAAVTVCPSCLFASPDKRDFITFSVQARSENKSQLGPFVLDELRGKVEERKMLLAPVSDFTAHFKQPRSAEAAVNSYRLAIHRALVEASLETPLSWYKAGMYGLRIALLLRDSGKEDDAVLKDSADYLAKSFRNSELKTPEMEYQLLYTLSALYLRIGDQAQCQAYLGVLDKTKAELVKREKEDPTVNTTHVEKWLEKAKDLWTDRELPDLWKH